jgi:nuclear pore complex protein Nup214
VRPCARDNQVCIVRCAGGEGSERDDERTCCVLEIEDDRCVASVPLAGADEDSNYVVGLLHVESS